MSTVTRGSIQQEKTPGLLDGVTVVDFAVGMAGALTAKFLAEMGAKVYRVPPAGGDPFYEVYPAYKAWRHQEIVEEAATRSPDLQGPLIRDADICIIGGEDYPGLKHRRDAKELAAKHPRLIVLGIVAQPDFGESAPLRAVDILVQARAATIFELSDERPIPLSFQPCNYGAMLQGLAGIAAALVDRERTGRGQVVCVSLLEGALSWVQPTWASAEKPTPKFQFVPPKKARPIILKCRGGSYVHIVLGGVGSKYRLYKVLGIDDPSIAQNDAGLPKLNDPPALFFGDIDFLAPYVADRERGELLRALWEAELVAEPVLSPGECWDDPQVKHNGIVTHAADGSAYVGNPVTWKGSPPKESPAPRTEPASADGRPLDGMKVVDFGAFVAGPLASVGLGDFGADVIKVEPLEGDPMRPVHRWFASVNRGKRSISIDLKTPDGIAIAHRLCERADVVCSNFRVGAAARLGIDAASLHPKQPATVVLNNAGYGVDGPKARNPAFDPALQAVSGLEVRAGGQGNAPLFNRLTPIDFAGGLLGTVAVTLALYRRLRDGLGAELIIPLLNVAVFFLSELIRQPNGVFAGAQPLDREQTGFHPAEKIYRTRDGWIAVCARDEDSAKSLANALSVGQLIVRPRSEWSDAEAAVLAESIRAQPAKDVEQKLQQADVWCEICRHDGEKSILTDPVLRARGTIYQANHPEYGRVHGIGPLVSFSRARFLSRFETPLKGQHTRELLGELGYEASEIDSLYERKIVT